MSARQAIEALATVASDESGGAKADELERLLLAPRTQPAASALPAVIVGELVAIADEGHTPLVCFEGQRGTAALCARSTVDLHGAHIGRSVTLVFEQGDPARPIVTGVLRGEAEVPPALAQVEADADGRRLLVAAKDQLVLRCGQASITLTREGQVLIEGRYVSSRSSGVNRIRGGSVQVN
jgi:hypothetical protein